MQKIIELTNKINFPKDVTNEIINLFSNYDIEEIYNHFKQYIKGNFELSKVIKNEFNNDNKLHLLWLYLYFKEALITHEKYKELNISDDVFYDTMAIFTRTVEEQRQRTNIPKFIIEDWVHNQINLKLFRLGTLEFQLQTNEEEISIENEVIIKKEEKVLSIHIPSDSVLTKENINHSYNLARSFMNEYFKEYKDSKFICYTWLISPDLDNIIKEGSKINNFREDFKIVYLSNHESYEPWLFGTTGCKVIDLPEITSLQKQVKQHLLNNGKVRNATGVIIKF